MSGNLHIISDDSFENDVLNSDTPVLVDFWAEWCRPCQMLLPIIEEVAGEFTGKIKVAKMDVEENNQTPAKYSIVGIPTLLVFKGGKLVGRKSGMMNKNQLSDFINSHL